ncbi:unnamed protein product [Symbiodinium sp. CCMP2592]|nr:unnamed protein product [Symbiodinium sp. CCMP2592]
MGDAPEAPQQLSFFSEDADCLLGSPLKKVKLEDQSTTPTATPSPTPGKSDATSSPSPSLSPEQLAALRAEGLGVSSDGKLTCMVCKMAGRGRKMRFCTPCARDVAAAKKDAQENGWIALYEEQAKADDTFVLMILKYQKSCGTKGRGIARNKFDHVSFRETLYRKKAVRRGIKEVMLDWGEFTQHFQKKGYSAREFYESMFRLGPEILEKWQQLQNDGAETDLKGRKGQELRVSTETETFKLDFTEEGTEMARDLSHTSKKFKAEDVEELDDAVRNFARPQIPGAASHSSSPPGQPPASAAAENKDKSEKNKPKEQRKTPLSRRVALHDSALQAVRKSQEALRKLPDKMKETIAKFESEEAEYEEYMRILRARAELCGFMGQNDDSKTRDEVEKAALATQEALENYIKSLSTSKQSYLTDGGSNLKSVPMALHLAFSVLSKNSHEEIDQWKNDWEDVISGLVQIATLMDQSIKDLESAKRARDKKRQRDADAEKKKAEREEQKRVKKDLKDQLKAGATGMAAPKAAAVPVVEVPKKNILQVPTDIMEKVGEMTEADFAQLDTSEKKEIINEPLLITDCEQTVRKLRAMNKVKAQMTMFRSQFTTTSHVKATGRAQLPITAADQIEEVFAVLKALDPACTQWPKTLPAGHDLTPFVQPYIYGFTDSMVYIGGEDKWAGQVRIQLSGVRYVVLAAMSPLVDALGLKGKGINEVAKAFSDMDKDQVEKLGVDKDFKLQCAVQSSHSALYVPPGWICAEYVRSAEEIVGLKMASVHVDALASFREIFEQKEAADSSSPMVKAMKAYMTYVSSN